MIETYLQLFYTFFKIGLFGFGGGYAMLSMIQYEVVEAHQWLTAGEFTDIIAISQITPGPIAINSATYIGYQATGGSVLGSAVATFAVCLPSIIIMALICRFFILFKENKYVMAALSGMKPAAIGLIAAAAILLMNKQNFTDYASVLIFIGTFALSYFFKWGAIRTIILAAVAGYVIY
ncbi:MAG: chromate transporter [Tannerella sp.]|jgi:chromate transporter|nr:chromate transporter [Tannerella sp.]